jgi:hypothetical protein
MENKIRHFIWVTGYALFIAILLPVVMWAAQTYVTPSGSTDHQTEHLTNIYNRDQTLRSSWSGATAPTSPIAGQLFFDTDVDTLQIRNAADSAWLNLGLLENENTWINDQTILKTAAAQLIVRDSDQAVENRLGADFDKGYIGTFSNHGLDFYTNSGVAATFDNAGILTLLQNQNIQHTTNPSLSITDTTNTVTSRLYSADTFGAAGTLSNHPFHILANSVQVGTFATSGDLSLTGIFSSTKSCAANYTRSGPNSCIRTGGSFSTTTLSTSCASLDLTALFGVPSTAKEVELQTEFQLASGTAAGEIHVVAIFASDSGCINQLGGAGKNRSVRYAAYNPLTSPGTRLADDTVFIRLFINGQTTIYAQKSQISICAGCTDIPYIRDVVAYWE